MTDEYVKWLGVSVQCPPVMKRAFLIRSSLASKIIWQGIQVDPTGVCSPCSKNQNAMAFFFISLSMAWCQWSNPVSLLIWYAALMVCRTWVPYLWVFFSIRDLTALMMRVACFRVKGTHHLKVTWSSRPLETANSACMGYASLRSVSSSQDVRDVCYHCERFETCCCCQMPHL